MKPTITFTTKKEIGKIKLPWDVCLHYKNNYLAIGVGVSISEYIKSDLIRDNIIRVLSNYAKRQGDGIYVPNIIVEHQIGSYSEYTFYEETEETIELTSYEQGCNVLSDIFTPMG